MSLAASLGRTKFCFVACPEHVRKRGGCQCHNQISNLRTIEITEEQAQELDYYAIEQMLLMVNITPKEFAEGLCPGYVNPEVPALKWLGSIVKVSHTQVTGDNINHANMQWLVFYLPKHNVYIEVARWETREGGWGYFTYAQVYPVQSQVPNTANLIEYRIMPTAQDTAIMPRLIAEEKANLTTNTPTI